jgi:hypothetical protein
MNSHKETTMSGQALKSVCPKCAGQMEEGFVVDRGHGNRFNVSCWVAGAPESGFWGLKIRDKARRPVRTLRCVNCGFLESYAVEALKRF